MDSIYINKVLKGDVDAFRYFVTTYKDYAFSLAYSILKNEYQAEEALQEAYIKAFEKLSQFRKDASFKTWLGRIVINTSLKKVGGVKSIVSADEYQPIINGNDLEFELNQLEKQDLKHYITVVFEKMTSQESLVLDLFYIKEHAIKEIQESTGWSESKTKMLLVRGRNSFYTLLKSTLKKEYKELL